MAAGTCSLKSQRSHTGLATKPHSKMPVAMRPAVVLVVLGTEGVGAGVGRGHDIGMPVGEVDIGRGGGGGVGWAV